MAAKITKSSGVSASQTDGQTAGQTAEQNALAALTFEAASADLDALVSRMESGDLPLEESITAYQRGVALVAHCEKLLAHAQHRVQVLQDGALMDYQTADQTGAVVGTEEGIA
jgi:exodeoxyribonuclease VII small subunit